MAEPIQISVDFTGGEAGARGIGQVTAALGALDTQAESAQQSTAAVDGNFDAFARGGQSFVQRVQGMAGATQSLVSALGSSNRTAGLVASLAGSTAQFAAMGAMLGPAGAVVGGVAGFAAGVIGLASAHREVRPEIEETTEAIRAEGEAALTASEAMAQFLESVTTASRVEGLRSLSDQITSLTDEMYRLRDAGDGIGAEVMAERIRTLQRLESSERANLDEETRTTGRPRTGRGGGGRERQGDDRGLYDALSNDLGGVSVQEDEMERRRALIERELDVEAEMNQAAADAELERQQLLAEGRLAIKERELEESERLEQEHEDRLNELKERALAQREQQGEEIVSLFSGTTKLIGDAIKDIATGEKTSEEAFKGLAAAFLEMISQYASLKAATEFADAAASFARYDYGGGAAHIGAGLAFTAVAVATGVGAAVLNAPPSAPARPEASTQDSGGSNGGDVYIAWNSPVVTAGTRAELGREISTMVGEAASL